MPSEILTNNATKLALSTPKELNLDVIVAEMAEAKSKVGISLRGRQGDNKLLSKVCDFVRSMQGLPKFDDNNKPTRLDDDTMKLIKEAINTFWQRQFNKVLGYGEVMSIDYDKPSVEYAEGEVSDVCKNAKIHVRASCEDSRERKFFAITSLTVAKKRLATMKDRPSVYTRDQYAAQENKISALEREIARLTVLFPNL